MILFYQDFDIYQGLNRVVPSTIGDNKMKLKFIINRMIDDGHPKTIICEIERPEDFCHQVDGYCTEFDEAVYDRFCEEAPRIARAISGLEIGRDWFFDYGPTIIEVA